MAASRAAKACVAVLPRGETPAASAHSGPRAFAALAYESSRARRASPASLPPQLVPGMRIARHLHAQRVDGGVGAAQQRAQIGPAEGEVHGLLGPADDAEALAVGREHPDAAGSRAVDAADAVDLQAVGDAGLGAFV